MKQSIRGFTIVELLIVIVVIAILAAISIVAYNGIQTRAKNTKTINATSAWIKAIKLFNAEKDSWPVNNSCFGSMTTYQGSGGQCFDNSVFVVRSGFLTEMQPYIDASYPEPDTTDVTLGGANTPRRGSFYHISGSDRVVWMFLSNVSTCPDMGLPINGNTASEPGGRRCVYKLN